MAIKTPFEKALELLTRFQEKSHKMGDYSSIYTPTAKHHAIICVEQIIASREDDESFDDILYSTIAKYYSIHPMYLNYWLQVKQELENL